MKFLKKISKISLTILLISQTAFGLDAKYLPQGTAAPFEGYLLTVPKAKQVRNKLLEVDTLQSINTSLTNSINIQKDITALTEDKVKILMEQNDRLAKSLMDERSVSNWERFFWFSMGIVGAGIAVWSIKKVAQ